MVFHKRRRHGKMKGKKKGGKLAKLTREVHHMRTPLNVVQTDLPVTDVWDTNVYTTNQKLINLIPDGAGLAGGPLQMPFGEGQSNFRYKISSINISLKFSYTYSLSNNGVGYTYRIIVGINKAGTSAFPSWNGSTNRQLAFLDYVPGSGTTGTKVQSLSTVALKNPEVTNAEYEIIYDKLISLNAVLLEKNLRFFIPSKHLNKISTFQRSNEGSPATWTFGDNTYQLWIICDKPDANGTSGQNDCVVRGQYSIGYRTC